MSYIMGYHKIFLFVFFVGFINASPSLPHRISRFSDLFCVPI